jgi:hypothetical protein
MDETSITSEHLPENPEQEYENVDEVRPSALDHDLTDADLGSKAYEIPASTSTQGVHQENVQPNRGLPELPTQQPSQDTLAETGYMSLVDNHTYEPLQIKHRLDHG